MFIGVCLIKSLVVVLSVKWFFSLVERGVTRHHMVFMKLHIVFRGVYVVVRGVTWRYVVLRSYTWGGGGVRSGY